MQRSLILGALLLAASSSLAVAQSSGTASAGGSFSASGPGHSTIGGSVSVRAGSGASGSVSVQTGSGGTTSGSLDFHVDPEGAFEWEGPIEQSDEAFSLCDLLRGLVSQADLEASGCTP